MKKAFASLVLSFTLGLVGLALGGLVSKPFTFSPSTLIKSSEVNSNFDTIYNEFNGNISDANISSSAAIQQSKISTLVTDLAARLLDTGDTITGALQAKFASPYFRWTGTEGSAKDWQLKESGGSLFFAENTGSESSPTWTTRYIVEVSGSTTADQSLTPKSYVDGLTRSLGFAKVTKVDGNFSMSGSTFTDVANLGTFVTTGAHRARITLIGSGTFSDTGGNDGITATVKIDGAAQGGSTSGLVFNSITNGGSGQAQSVNFSFVSDVLSAGSHSFAIAVAHTNGGNVTLNATAASPAIMIVEELPY